VWGARAGRSSRSARLKSTGCSGLSSRPANVGGVDAVTASLIASVVAGGAAVLAFFSAVTIAVMQRRAATAAWRRNQLVRAYSAYSSAFDRLFQVLLDYELALESHPYGDFEALHLRWDEEYLSLLNQQRELGIVARKYMFTAAGVVNQAILTHRGRNRFMPIPRPSITQRQMSYHRAAMAQLSRQPMNIMHAMRADLGLTPLLQRWRMWRSHVIAEQGLTQPLATLVWPAIELYSADGLITELRAFGVEDPKVVTEDGMWFASIRFEENLFFFQDTMVRFPRSIHAGTEALMRVPSAEAASLTIKNGLPDERKLEILRSALDLIMSAPGRQPFVVDTDGSRIYFWTPDVRWSPPGSDD